MYLCAKENSKPPVYVWYMYYMCILWKRVIGEENKCTMHTTAPSIITLSRCSTQPDKHPPSPQVSHHPAINSAPTLPKWDYSFCLHCTVTHFARFLHFEMERNKKNNEGKKKKFAVITIPVLQVAGFALFFKKNKQKKKLRQQWVRQFIFHNSNCQRIDINASWWRRLSSWANALMMVWKHAVWLT